MQKSPSCNSTGLLRRHATRIVPVIAWHTVSDVEPLLLITNADAGNSDELGSALEVLRSGTSVLHRAGSRPIVVAGGDGSLHAVIATLYRRNDLTGKTLGLLPLGTGNDFARAVGIPLDAAAAAQALLDGTPRLIDLVVDELGEVVVNNVHVGASVIASRSGAVWKDRLSPFGLGLFGYPIGAALAAVNPPSARYRIEVDGTVVVDVDRQVLMISIGNGSSVGGGTKLTPQADPSNGTVDVMVAFAADPLARLGYALDLLRRRHHDRDDVMYLRGSNVSISGEDFWISADGELSGPERRRTWHVERAAYSLMVP
jgi:diacylglycerol kinase (ATP)